MPRGQKIGWKEKTLVPGKKVPGDENRGILYTKGGRFAAYFNYANRRCYAGTFEDLPSARVARDEAIATRRSGKRVLSLKATRQLFHAFVIETFFPESFGTTKKGTAKKASTIRAAESRYRVYLQPFFGPLMLEDVTYEQIRTFRARLDAGTFGAPEVVELPARTEGGAPRRYRPRRTTSLSEKSKREILILLRQILAEASRSRGIPNPFPEDFIPAGDRPEITPPNLSTALKIAKAIHSLPHRTLTYVLIYTGCRLGEAIALRWEDIDFDRHRMQIARSADAKTREIQEPKTKRAKRSIPLDAALAKELRRYRNAQESGHAPSLGTWLFPTTKPNEDAGTFVIDQRSYVQRHFDPARQSVTAEHVTPHMLRHTWCSLAVTKYPVAYVSKWAGHHDASFTFRVYVQPFEDEERRLTATFALRTRK